MQRHLKTKRTCFVTVGSTSFSSLVHAVLSNKVLKALQEAGISVLTVQRGKSTLPGQWTQPAGLSVDLVEYVDDVDERISRADLVISHAGAGSILAALRGPALAPAPPTPVIVVANPDLLDNHQDELAYDLKEMGLVSVAYPDTLSAAIAALDWHATSKPTQLPQPNVAALQHAIDGH